MGFREGARAQHVPHVVRSSFDLKQELDLFRGSRKGTYFVFCFLNRTDQLPSDGYRVVNQRNPVTTPEHPPIPRDRSSRGLDENFAAMSLQRGEAEQTSVTRAFQTKGPSILRTIHHRSLFEPRSLPWSGSRRHPISQCLGRLERTINGESYGPGVNGMKVKTRISRPSPSIKPTFHPHLP
jgi:hypothetical protein